MNIYGNKYEDYARSMNYSKYSYMSNNALQTLNLLTKVYVWGKTEDAA